MRLHVRATRSIQDDWAAARYNIREEIKQEETSKWNRNRNLVLPSESPHIRNPESPNPSIVANSKTKSQALPQSPRSRVTEDATAASVEVEASKQDGRGGQNQSGDFRSSSKKSCLLRAEDRRHGRVPARSIEGRMFRHLRSTQQIAQIGITAARPDNGRVPNLTGKGRVPSSLRPSQPETQTRGEKERKANGNTPHAGVTQRHPFFGLYLTALRPCIQLLQPSSGFSERERSNSSPHAPDGAGGDDKAGSGVACG
ncbi:hypothetical protein B0H13DRAFT_1929077 [Mycena leptocephala]|nr:hypothetical protein B0H13DRAFT_1929077 [Mycena leptocephala]